RTDHGDEAGRSATLGRGAGRRVRGQPNDRPERDAATRRGGPRRPPSGPRLVRRAAGCPSTDGSTDDVQQRDGAPRTRAIVAPPGTGDPAFHPRRGGGSR